MKGLVFDKDGTLFDFAATWQSWTAGLLRRLGGPDAERLGDAIGFDMTTQQFRAGSVVIAGTPGDIADALIPLLPGQGRGELLAIMDAEAATAPQAEAVPLRPLLNGLRADGYVLGVATNDSEAPARAHLASVEITEFFTFIAGFDSGFGGKPAPGQLLGFCEATGLAPSTCAMIGDSRHDLGAGRAAGFTTIGVLTGLAGADELAELADVILPDIGHLPDWLARRG